MKRLLLALGILLGISLAAFHSEPAKADTFGGVTCTPQGASGGTYPVDGTHFLVCFTGNDPGRTMSVYQVFQNLPKKSNHPGATNPFAWDLFVSQGVTLYYFDTEAHAISYTKAKYGSGNQVVPSSVKCGYTGYTFGMASQTINTYVFDQCHYSTGNVTNPGLGATTAHESGHAYDYAIASDTLVGGKGNAISISSGFKTLVNYDLSHLNTAFTTCSLFDGQAPSTLEVQLGAAHPGAVCNGNTINPNYTGYANNQAILAAESPYFVTNGTLFEELFAEEWAPYQQGFNGTILPFFDHVSPQLSCSQTVLVSLLNTGYLPNKAGQSYPTGCPTVTDAQLTPNIP